MYNYMMHFNCSTSVNMNVIKVLKLLCMNNWTDWIKASILFV